MTHLEWKSLQEIRPHQRDGIQGSDEADDLFGSLFLDDTNFSPTKKRVPVFLRGVDWLMICVYTYIYTYIF